MILKSPLVQLVTSSPLLTTSIGLWGVAMLTFLTKDAPHGILSFLTRQLTTSLEVTSREKEFDALANWIEFQGFARRFRTLRARNMRLSAGFGRHYFLHKGYLCWFHRTRVKEKDYELEEIALTCLGRDQRLLRDLVAEAAASVERSDQTRIYFPRWHNWSLLTVQDKRPLSSVFLSAKNKNALIYHLDWFQSAGEWHRQHGVPYRTGIFLHGPPGTGKTSLVRAICASYDLGLYTMDLINSNDHELKEMVCQLGPRSLFLLEDIDTVSAAWRRKSTKEGEGNEKLTLGGVLNAIDGVAQSDGRVLVMTANHQDMLDQALLRPGRVDLQLELGPMTPEMFQEAFERFFPNTPAPPNFEWPAHMTPAEFQQMVMRHIRSPKEVLKSLENHGLRSLQTDREPLILETC